MDVSTSLHNWEVEAPGKCYELNLGFRGSPLNAEAPAGMWESGPRKSGKCLCDPLQ